MKKTATRSAAKAKKGPAEPPGTPPLAAKAAPEPSKKRHLVRDLSQSFFELLLKHRNHYVSAVSDENLSPMQSHALNYIGEHPCTMRELSDSAFVEPSNLTGIIDKLEARGLVTRREASVDRRSKIVSLTPAGSVLRKRLWSRFSEPAPWMLALTIADQKQLLEIVRKAIDYEKSLESPSSRSPRPREPIPPPGTSRPAHGTAARSSAGADQGKRTKK